MIHCLDESSLPNDKRVKSERDAQIMLNILKVKTEQKADDSKLSIKTDIDLPTTLNDAVGFGYNVSEGHYAKANVDIKVGDSILIEKPHCAVLLEKYSKTHCQHCFLRYQFFIILMCDIVYYNLLFYLYRTIAPIVCPNCPNIIFCSEKCKEIAMHSYHKIECNVLPLIWRSGSSINCHMALRIISQKSLEYFIELKDQLENDLNFDDILK